MLLKCRIVAESVISHLCWRCADSVHSSPSLGLRSPDPSVYGLAESSCVHVSWRIWSAGELQHLLYKPIKACSGKCSPFEELPEMSCLGEGKVTASRTHCWVGLDAQQSSLEANFSLWELSLLSSAAPSYGKHRCQSCEEHAARVQCSGTVVRLQTFLELNVLYLCFDFDQVHYLEIKHHLYYHRLWFYVFH